MRRLAIACLLAVSISGSSSLAQRAGVGAWPTAQPVQVRALTAPHPEMLSAATARQIERHYQYILGAQRPSGAIALTPGGRSINPYFANTAAQALATEPRFAEPVRRYMEWYLANLNGSAGGKAAGTIDDHRVTGGQERPTGSYDSADSYAATFLSLVHNYVRSTGDIEWVRRHRNGIQQVTDALVSLTDGDGLTWARPGYRLKLLMDNSEVFAGWNDWAAVLERLGEAEAAAQARSRAGAIRAALPRFRQADGNFSWALGPLGWRQRSYPARLFYPDAVAQFFPQLFGLEDTAGGFQRFAAARWDWQEQVHDRFPWMVAAYAARHAGDDAASEQAIANADQRFPTLRYPWHVAESAWLIGALLTAGAATAPGPS